MKTPLNLISKLSLVLALTLTLATPFAPPAEASQVIVCTFSGSGNPDAVWVTLTSPQSGTFAYRSAPTGPGTTSDEGSLPLKRAASTIASMAQFSVESQVMNMDFQMPVTLISAPADAFGAKLITKIDSMNLREEQALLCKSTL